jgi:hypothetical protein
MRRVRKLARKQAMRDGLIPDVRKKKPEAGKDAAPRRPTPSTL